MTVPSGKCNNMDRLQKYKNNQQNSYNLFIFYFSLQMNILSSAWQSKNVPARKSCGLRRLLRSDRYLNIYVRNL